MASGGEEQKKLKLYSYILSSCAHRVRIALKLKVEYRVYSAQSYWLRACVGGEDIVVSDSLAIMMYLEEKYPQHPLLPRDLQRRAINYQAANIVSSSVQPLQNAAVPKYIEEKVNPDEKFVWVKYHMDKGFAALEKLLKDYAGKYATGDEVYLADCFIAPMTHGAIKRFSVDMTPYPLLYGLNEAYNELPAFQDAVPEKQPDTPV